MKSTFEQELEKNGKLVYTNVGYSMMPLLRQKRDLIIIEKPNGRLKKYDVPLYKRPNGQYVLHRILKVRENDYVICGDHCTRREYGVTDEQIIGVLTAFVRNGKTYSVSHKGYRAYVHLWCDFFYIRVSVLRAKAAARRLFKRRKP
ncbi:MULTISPECIES: S24/S26 family peptidase [unclassified Ruminococcus]|uniref:S24/S26 family peptidase n=1 Tax=unclassified Ruminococcus TaxID=2608920 RepID=UPI0021086D89|nr:MULTISPECIES: S24/S26 family peptidase [unclassified Ruminococcus]MCQ4021828.1 hypothetical protein [Ruminococcus sp. zg-924]MCQ4114273.1 hypothetical protein [Ruminococcus sp. zg-921]